ncbi:hypothetical protein ACUNI0_14455 [Serratia sp. IR-2025]
MLTTERMAEIAKLAIRLQQISSCAAVTSSGETVLHHTHVGEILSALHDVTSELLANREAQPVAYAVFADNGNIRIWSTDKGITDNVGVSVPLFTAPPAPAVNAAPDFEAWFNSPEAGLRVVNFHIQHELQKKAWEACRAAMLAQPVSSGYKLVPVEPTDEQLRLMLAVQWPALYREHLRHPLNGPKSREENERQIAIVKRQYAAMLAAAPEGGNDHDTRR